jgi:hypothetical protein
MAVDPVRSGTSSSPQSWNRYGYTRGNPLKLIDPDGRDVELVVRNSSAVDRVTNRSFGHTALRVFGPDYDLTFDFGRYRRVWGSFNSQGEGVLRVWRNWHAFLARQTPRGPVTSIRVDTTQEFDSAVIAFFTQLIESGQLSAFESHYEEYILAEVYDLLDNNCTTICIDALDEAAERTMQPFAELDHLRPEYDPNSLFHLVRDMEKNWRTRTDPLLSFFNYQR